MSASISLPVVLIPAYEPDTRLVQLVEDLVGDHRTHQVVVVDDGSGPLYASLFRTAAGLGGLVVVTIGHGLARAVRAVTLRQVEAVRAVGGVA